MTSGPEPSNISGRARSLADRLDGDAWIEAARPHPALGAVADFREGAAALRELAEEVERGDRSKAHVETRLPSRLSKDVVTWLAANHKGGRDVRWGAYPHGMVLRWVERAEKAETRIAELEAALKHIAEWPDENMATARTLHYDMRGWARGALR